MCYILLVYIMWSVTFCWSTLCDLLQSVGLHYVICYILLVYIMWSVTFPPKTTYFLTSLRKIFSVLMSSCILFSAQNVQPHLSSNTATCQHISARQSITKFHGNPLSDSRRTHFPIVPLRLWVNRYEITRAPVSPELQYHQNGFIAAKDTTNCTALNTRIPDYERW